MKRYIDILKKCGIETYALTLEKSETVEVFYVKKNLDMRRIRNTEEVRISVYKDVEEDGRKLRGTSTVVFGVSVPDDEIEEKIKAAEYSAGFALNPAYSLHKGEVSKEVTDKSNLMDFSLKDIAEKFVSAAYSADCDREAFINSYELFVAETHKRIVTSEGTDVSYVSRKVNGEFVAQCKEPQDVETYMDFEYGSMALSEMKALVESTLLVTKDRAKATGMPEAGKYDVIISGRYVPTITSFYLERANAALIYPGYSNYKVGDKVQGEEIQGDTLDIMLGVTTPFSDEGIRMIERPLLEEGVLKTIHGSERFCDYLKVPQVSEYEKVILPAGKMSLEDMKNRPCLHVVNFSDFQMDALDGHFAGEIRLAYLYDGKGNVKCVTGGSINGSFLTAQKDIYLSKETQELAYYVGPVAMLIKEVSVAGE